MAEFKLVLGLKNGKSVQRVVKDAEAKPLLGMKIGEKLKGDKLGLTGFEFEIAGGSDYCGFPMRKDLTGTGRKRVLITRGIGMNKKGKGLRQRRTVCGNTIHAKISQINLKVLKEGKAKLAEAPKEEPKQKAEPKEHGKKPEPKKKVKAQEKPAEKPAKKVNKAAPKAEKPEDKK